MRMRLRRTLSAAMGLLALSAPVDAQPSPPGVPVPLESCAREAVARIQSRYERARDLEARFEQWSRGGALPGGEERRSKGRVAFAKPGRMRWTYEEPEKSLVVSDGKTLWLYDESRREVQQLSVAGGYFSGASIQFLLGEGDVDAQFRVRALACDARSAELELTPRQPESFETLRIRADRASGDLRETVVVDLLGNETRVVFSEIRVDQGLPRSLFEFSPPPDAQVIEYPDAATDPSR